MYENIKPLQNMSWCRAKLENVHSLKSSQTLVYLSIYLFIISSLNLNNFTKYHFPTYDPPRLNIILRKAKAPLHHGRWWRWCLIQKLKVHQVREYFLAKYCMKRNKDIVVGWIKAIEKKTELNEEPWLWMWLKLQSRNHRFWIKCMTIQLYKNCKQENTRIQVKTKP